MRWIRLRLLLVVGIFARVNSGASTRTRTMNRWVSHTQDVLLTEAASVRLKRDCRRCETICV